MYSVELIRIIDEPWTAVDPILLGRIPTDAGMPGAYVTVERDDVPLVRIDVWPQSSGPFTQLSVWKSLVVLGWNDQVHLIDPLTRQVTTFQCDGYFGHFYPVGDQLLIADAVRLICCNLRGEQVWESNCLGIDGVIVDEVRNGVVLGQGEWDPPGGWRPFRISAETGEPVAK